MHIFEMISSLISCFEPLKDFGDFKLKIASKHPFLNQAIYFILLNSFLESNCRIFLLSYSRMYFQKSIMRNFNNSKIIRLGLSF
jgi:hypothetical protein